MGVDPGRIDDRRAGVDAEAGGAAHRLGGMGGGEQGLGGHAARIQAVPAHQVPFDQRDLRPQPCRARGRHETCGPRSDHHEVVARSGLRILPLRRMDILDERPVMFVLGED